MSGAADDARFMAAAIELSLKHLGQTSTNPSVGCLIVKDGVVVGRGVTAKGGRPHAEALALNDAGEAARGATAYVTLEPCSHHGKTPPCANALVAAGIARVVVAVTDPDERVSGRGLKILRDAGIEVTSSVLEEEGRCALAGYLTRQTKGRPYVILKLAVSADGMIGRRGEGQVAITGPMARNQVQLLRSVTDAILVGVGTAMVDDPELTVRLEGLEDRSPIRIVLDRRLELPIGSKLARTAREVPVIVVCGALAPVPEDRVSEAAGPDNRAARKAALEAMGVEVLEAPDLDCLLLGLASRGISSLLVEGGARVAADFLAADLVDEIDLYQGDVSVGPDGIASPVTRETIPQTFRPLRSQHLGSDRLDIFERVRKD
ncbi:MULTISPECIES: bifunctional diaminohydroxyphosphoribosylaminopyrimidine deaminase/5-amino-6-(5-phosphoribosylamino)uracil reductase RibD [Alphaproteobacteria]|uniref:Riboflavin biosynthesis protein RibD n=2 Tax=Alphaproteobacteria TaxID=28211 RepID=A0A512HGU6_9HYPH|nr:MULTISPECIES: bifunctional diaminohydroxyphosphoribosylaminopyrimidine deaminase/5-amino-6-(5-phosphoribosylamino)uracil reductase RibD [Alphaproteobacteria]GEO84610.1 bifunctional diaminohydroxyphosphoribosylaminopyrimidine deaminase/5-amino-6-(5-phosphoribosylamino)uracil reductase [Ciceribacter naphthalenivorans]GLR22573.1 bifunctional diaminohydroxyphosphoribosylaminopyrimidine deaminase/5-amino-6-(5-phosphoribosylamino)uracil reductase [Ciceribacter naphthalenivorans]GLT05429.1 bifunctio